MVNSLHLFKNITPSTCFPALRRYLILLTKIFVELDKTFFLTVPIFEVVSPHSLTSAQAW